VAEILAWQAAKGEEGDAALAHLHAKVLEARTPAQLAHDLGLDAQHVRDLLEERLGVHVSKGAALRYSYTRRDLERFDDATKERLFATLVDDLGADAMVRRAAGVADDWWETPAGKGLDDVLGLADVELGHVSERRAPIARWQSTFLWIGFVAAAVTAIAVIPAAIWLGSWKAWRAGRTGRPAAGIGLGVVAVAAVVVAVVVSAL
jgi:hypothetical protein